MQQEQYELIGKLYWDFITNNPHGSIQQVHGKICYELGKTNNDITINNTTNCKLNLSGRYLDHSFFTPISKKRKKKLHTHKQKRQKPKLVLIDSDNANNKIEREQEEQEREDQEQEQKQEQEREDQDQDQDQEQEQETLSQSSLAVMVSQYPKISNEEEEEEEDQLSPIIVPYPTIGASFKMNDVNSIASSIQYGNCNYDDDDDSM